MTTKDKENERLANELAAILKRGGEKRDGEYTILIRGWRNEVKVTASGEVNITLHYLAPEKAKAILRTVKRILDT